MFHLPGTRHIKTGAEIDKGLDDLRMGVGLLIGILCVDLFDITGIYRAVVIFDSVMPAAAMSSVLTAKYNNEVDLVASVVFVTTLMSLVIIPFLLYVLV